MSRYDRLRPNIDIETCECEEVSKLLLVYMFTDNPINCFKCRKEIDSERLGLSGEMCDDIARVFNVYGALYNLWLDSGEYELDSKNKLLDKNGQVNINGMKLAKKLSNEWKTYYWWFYDTDDGEPENCPNCSCKLTENVYFGTGICEKCNIAI